MSSKDPDIIEARNTNFTYKNPYKIATFVSVFVVLSLVGLTVFLFIDNSDKYKQIADLQGFIATLGGKNNEIGNNNPVGNGNPKDWSDYLVLENAGIAIPLSPQIKDKIEVKEIEDSDAYAIHVKSILKYREQGYCGNGGSSAVGIVSPASVAIQNNAVGGDTSLVKKKSQWSDGTIAVFENNVVYPDSYVTFNNLDAVCIDTKDGHDQRLKEVAKEVQEINDALEEAFLDAIEY